MFSDFSFHSPYCPHVLNSHLDENWHVKSLIIIIIYMQIDLESEIVLLYAFLSPKIVAVWCILMARCPHSTRRKRYSPPCVSTRCHWCEQPGLSRWLLLTTWPHRIHEYVVVKLLTSPLVCFQVLVFMYFYLVWGWERGRGKWNFRCMVGLWLICGNPYVWQNLQSVLTAWKITNNLCTHVEKRSDEWSLLETGDFECVLRHGNS